MEDLRDIILAENEFIWNGLGYNPYRDSKGRFTYGPSQAFGDYCPTGREAYDCVKQEKNTGFTRDVKRVPGGLAVRTSMDGKQLEAFCTTVAALEKVRKDLDSQNLTKVTEAVEYAADLIKMNVPILGTMSQMNMSRETYESSKRERFDNLHQAQKQLDRIAKIATKTNENTKLIEVTQSIANTLDNISQHFSDEEISEKIIKFDGVENSFPGHAGRPGFVGGSLPRGGSSVIKFSVDGYSQEKLKSVLEKYGCQTDIDPLTAIINKAYDRKAEQKMVAKMKEKYGEDFWDGDEYLSDPDYLDYEKYRSERIQNLRSKIDAELGITSVAPDAEEHWIAKDTYDNIREALANGKLKDYINKGILAAQDDPNFVADLRTRIGIYKLAPFNYNTGEYGVKQLDIYARNGYSEVSEDNFPPNGYEKFKNTDMVKVSNNEIRSWMSILGRSGNFPPINSSEERALKEYNLVSAVNQQLREGKSSRTAEKIQSAIDKTYYPSLEVYRGLRGDFAKQISVLKKGDTITDKGFMSTSDTIGDGDGGASKFGSTILKIKTKAGFGQAIDMAPYVADFRFFSENEILLQSNTTIKYTGKSTKTKDKSDNPITIYEFEVI